MCAVAELVHGILGVIDIAAVGFVGGVVAVLAAAHGLQRRIIQTVSPHHVLQVFVGIIYATINDGQNLLGGIHLRCRSVFDVGIPAVFADAIASLVTPLVLGVIPGLSRR